MRLTRSVLALSIRSRTFHGTFSRRAGRMYSALPRGVSSDGPRSRKQSHVASFRCVCVRACVRACACMCMCTNVRVPAYVLVHVHVPACACACACAYACACACARGCAHVCAHAHARAWSCVVSAATLAHQLSACRNDREDARAREDAPYPLPREEGAHCPHLQLHAGD